MALRDKLHCRQYGKICHAEVSVFEGVVKNTVLEALAKLAKLRNILVTFPQWQLLMVW
jgi:hypothetical protein